jgi:F-type H+-transporting ATPase subunit b
VINLLLSAGHGPSFTIEGFYLLDFIIFVAVIVWLVRKPLASFVDTRHKRIIADMEEAQSLRREAEEKLQDYESRLANLEEEIAQILSDARTAGEEERKRILSEAAKTAERIRSDAVERLEQERRKLEHELQIKVVELAVNTAEGLIKSQISHGDHQRFIDEYVNDLSAIQGGKQ